MTKVPLFRILSAKEILVLNNLGIEANFNIFALLILLNLQPHKRVTNTWQITYTSLFQ